MSETEENSSPAVYSARLRRQLGEIIAHMRADIDRVKDPEFRAVLAGSAEILKSVGMTLAQYDDPHRKPFSFSQ